MADFNDVATNAEILRIAEAIRKATRTAEGMTIPEMPDRLMDIRVVEFHRQLVNLATPGDVEIAKYDAQLKHLFVATPYADTDNTTLTEALAQRALIFDQESGSLYMHTGAAAGQVELVVIDLLLATDEESGGILISGSEFQVTDVQVEEDEQNESNSNAE